MYHYLECGLPYIYLRNGVRVEDSDYGEVASVPNAHELHKEIAQQLILKSSTFKGRELRFVRHAFEWAQKRLAQELLVSESVVGHWEKTGEIPPDRIVAIRLLLAALVVNNVNYPALVKELKSLSTTEQSENRIEFNFICGRWISTTSIRQIQPVQSTYAVDVNIYGSANIQAKHIEYGRKPASTIDIATQVAQSKKIVWPNSSLQNEEVFSSCH